MFSTYKTDDVTLLLKDITGIVEPMETKAREKLIQGGAIYCEMLPIEYEPSEKYLLSYENACKLYSKMTADAVASVAEQIWRDKGESAVLVSLARAGISIGVLIKRYIKKKYNKDIKHYAISIIRGLGIDKNAMDFILKDNKPEDIQFVDAWTGKGAISRQLEKAMEDYRGVSAGLAVLSDPAYVAQKCGTHEDFLIPCSLLNSTVSGLISRTFYRKDIIDENDFHGAVFNKELIEKDFTYKFIELIEEKFDLSFEYVERSAEHNDSMKEVEQICKTFEIKDINLVKPSIGETTRVLLRRMPWKILVHSKTDFEHLGHLYELAKEKGVLLEEYPLKNYRACGLILEIADN